MYLDCCYLFFGFFTQQVLSSSRICSHIPWLTAFFLKVNRAFLNSLWPKKIYSKIYSGVLGCLALSFQPTALHKSDFWIAQENGEGMSPPQFWVLLSSPQLSGGYLWCLRQQESWEINEEPPSLGVDQTLQQVSEFALQRYLPGTWSQFSLPHLEILRQEPQSGPRPLIFSKLPRCFWWVLQSHCEKLCTEMSIKVCLKRCFLQIFHLERNGNQKCEGFPLFSLWCTFCATPSPLVLGQANHHTTHFTHTGRPIHCHCSIIFQNMASPQGTSGLFTALSN